jgi:hypothetical protein
MDCTKIEFKDKNKKPLMGIIEKEDSNYIYFRTRKGPYRFSHDSIEVIEPTNIPFEGGNE